MLINLWYAAEWADAVTDKPVKVKLLDTPLVLFRDGAGKLHCLADICIHRGGSLAGGWTDGDTVVCPYHGWKYDGKGKCVSVPSEGEDFRISERFQVDSYDVEERYGIVWVFMGDQPEEERIPLPEFPEFGDDKYRWMKTECTWEAEAARVLENGIDIAHTSFVHPSFGYQASAAKNFIERVEIEDFKGSSTAVLYPPQLTGVQKNARKDKQETRVHPSWNMSGMVVKLQIDINPTWTTIMFDANTPVDEHTTRTFAWQGRTFLKHKIFDGGAMKRLHRIFAEDKTIVEAASPYYLPEDLANEISVGDDKFMNSFRAGRRKLIDRGWQIDSYEKNKHLGRKVMTIPSPNRRKAEADGIKWVFDAVPLHPPLKERKATPEAAE